MTRIRLWTSSNSYLEQQMEKARHRGEPLSFSLAEKSYALPITSASFAPISAGETTT
jgi:hypothetical protein